MAAVGKQARGKGMFIIWIKMTTPGEDYEQY